MIAILPILKKMLCHVKQIYIEKNFIGSAYAGLFANSDHKVLGGMIGIRKSLLDQPSTLDEWASWKEQIHFGTDPSHVNVAQGLPIVHTSMKDGQLDMLYFLMAHELGHLFDFSNGVNQFVGCENQHDESCVSTPKPNSWGALSWKTDKTPLDIDNFPLRSSLCFYFCEGKFIPASRQDELYEGLGKTNFLSAYTTRYPTEDFADTFAFYTLMTERNASYVVETACGQSYDIIERLRSGLLLAPKKKFIEDFLSSPYKYPGDGSEPSGRLLSKVAY